MIEGVDPDELADALDPAPVDRALELLAAGDPDAPFTDEEREAIAGVQGSIRTVIEALEAAAAESLAVEAEARRVAREREARRRERTRRFSVALRWALVPLMVICVVVIGWGLLEILG